LLTLVTQVVRQVCGSSLRLEAGGEQGDNTITAQRFTLSLGFQADLVVALRAAEARQFWAQGEAQGLLGLETMVGIQTLQQPVVVEEQALWGLTLPAEMVEQVGTG
jgi:hypothetical protein